MKKASKYTNNGYKVPDDYFNNLDQKLFDKIEKQVATEAVLQDYKGTHGYTTPDSYFDALEKRVLDKSAPKVIPLFSWKKIAYSTAAIAATLVLIFTIYNGDSIVKTGDAIAAAIDTNQVYDYINDGELELTLFDIEELLLDQNIDISALNPESIQEEPLYEYLEDRLETEYILTE